MIQLWEGQFYLVLSNLNGGPQTVALRSVVPSHAVSWEVLPWGREENGLPHDLPSEGCALRFRNRLE